MSRHLARRRTREGEAVGSRPWQYVGSVGVGVRLHGNLGDGLSRMGKVRESAVRSGPDS